MFKLKLMIGILIILITGFSIGIILDAQEKTEDAPKITVKAQFRSIEVVVLNDDDEHMMDLKKNNFKVFENGIEREIVAIDEISFLEDEAKPQKKSQLSFEEQIAADETREEADSNSYIFMIANIYRDSGNIEKLSEGILSFIDDNLKSYDKVSIWIINEDGIKKVLDFTSDKKRIQEIFKKLFSMPGILPGEFLFQSAQKNLLMIDNLTKFSDYLSKIPGRKSILFFSKGIPIVKDMVDYKTATAEITGQETNQFDQVDKKVLQDIQEYKDKLRIETSLANVTIYGFDTVTKSRKRSMLSDQGLTTSSDDSGSSTGSLVGIQDPTRSMFKSSAGDQSARIGIVRDVVDAGEGELYLQTLARKSKLPDSLEEVHYINSHYYVITYRLGSEETSDKEIADVDVKVTAEDFDRAIFKKIVRAPK